MKDNEKNTIKNDTGAISDSKTNRKKGSKTRRVLLVVTSIIGFVFIGLASFVLFNNYTMNNMIDDEVNSLISSARQSEEKVFTYEMLEGLPKPVQRYFQYAMKDGQPYVRFASLKATGDFRMPKTDTWTDFDTTEYITTEKPGFIFEALMQKSSFIWVDLRDKYQDGAGGMHVNAFSGINVLSVLDEKKMNHTCFLRWAGEAVLFPTALLPSEHVKWESIDDMSAKAILTDGEIRSEYIFYFNDTGEITRYESSDRYDIIDGKYQKVGSIAYRSDYREINGVKIPTKFKIVRIYPGGKREEFWKGEISNVKYDGFSR
jgi:hypothetical protein